MICDFDARVSECSDIRRMRFANVWEFEYLSNISVFPYTEIRTIIMFFMTLSNYNNNNNSIII